MKEYLYRDDAINWTWFGTLVVDNENRWAYIKDTYRLHKFNKDQGSTQHPETPYSIACFNGGDPYNGITEHEAIHLTDNITGAVEVFNLCDLKEGVVTPRPLADWIIEQRKDRA